MALLGLAIRRWLSIVALVGMKAAARARKRICVHVMLNFLGLFRAALRKVDLSTPATFEFEGFKVTVVDAGACLIVPVCLLVSGALV